MPRTLAYMRLDELPGDARNPKDHDLEGLRASMQRFGFVEPIVLDERTGKLVSGHGRVEELQLAHAAGLDAPEGVEVDEAGVWSAPVLRGWASKDDAEAGAYIVAANRLTETGGWHSDPLAALLDEIAATGAGLDGTGYSREDFDDLLTQLSPPSLDDLRKTLGDEPTEEDMWPLLRLKLAPATRDDLVRELGEDGNDDERVRKLLARLS